MSQQLLPQQQYVPLARRGSGVAHGGSVPLQFDRQESRGLLCGQHFQAGKSSEQPIARVACLPMHCPDLQGTNVRRGSPEISGPVILGRHPRVHLMKCSAIVKQIGEHYHINFRSWGPPYRMNRLFFN
jgi:hypothetical protein